MRKFTLCLTGIWLVCASIGVVQASVIKQHDTVGLVSHPLTDEVMTKEHLIDVNGSDTPFVKWLMTSSTAFVGSPDSAEMSAYYVNFHPDAASLTTARRAYAILPEPATLVLLSFGILGLALARRQQKHKP